MVLGVLMKAGQRHSHNAFGLIATTEELSIYLCVLSEKAVNLLVEFAGENIEQFQSKEDHGAAWRILI